MSRKGRAGSAGCWLAAVFLCFRYLLPGTVAAGEGACTVLLTDAEVQDVCAALARSPAAEAGSEAMLRERRLADRAAVGQYRTLGDERECYRLAGAQVRIYAEEEQGVLVDRFSSYGDTSDTSHVQVLSCQVRHDQAATGRFVDVSVQLFWTATEPDRLTVTAAERRLRTGDSTGVRARLQCGPCPAPHRRVIFGSGPGGTLSPSESITDAQGIARSVFTLEREESVTVSARSGSRQAETVVEPRWRPWKVRVHARFQGNAEGYRGAAEFRAEFSGVLLGWIIGQAHTLIRSGDLAGYPLEFLPLHRPIVTSGILQGWESHLVGERWEKTSFDRQTGANLLIGLDFHDGRPDRRQLHVSLTIDPIHFSVGPAGQYFFLFWQGGCSPGRTVVTDATIPLDRPLPAQPFSRELVLRSADEPCGTWHMSFTFVPQQDHRER